MIFFGNKSHDPPSNIHRNIAVVGCVRNFGVPFTIIIFPRFTTCDYNRFGFQFWRLAGADVNARGYHDLMLST